MVRHHHTDMDNYVDAEGTVIDNGVDKDTDSDIQNTRRAPEQPAAHRADVPVDAEVDPAYRGFQFGAAFFGWLIAIAVTVLIVGVIGAVTTAVDYTGTIDWSAADENAGTVGLVSGIVLVAVMALAYYTGGYVAGRLTRFDGARQGLGVWVIGLITTVIVAGLGTLAGAEYNLLDRVDVPTVPLSNETLTTSGLIAAAVLALATLIAALVGGNAGQRYHRRFDTDKS